MLDLKCLRISEASQLLDGAIYSRLKPAEYKRIIQETIQNEGGLSLTESKRLLRQIDKTARCFQLDPILLSALVWRESHFRQSARSETSAVGLTQMTKAGIQEVFEKIHPKGFRRSTKLRNLSLRCTPPLLKSLPFELSADHLAALKNAVATDSTVALFFGAALLKSKLIRFSNRGRMDSVRLSLEHYNGDPRVKKTFALDVLSLIKKMNAHDQYELVDSKFLQSIRAI